MNSQLVNQINQLSREEIVKILQEKGGYRCYDHESTAELRETLRSDIERKILPPSVLN